MANDLPSKVHVNVRKRQPRHSVLVNLPPDESMGTAPGKPGPERQAAISVSYTQHAARPSVQWSQNNQQRKRKDTRQTTHKYSTKQTQATRLVPYAPLLKRHTSKPLICYTPYTNIPEIRNQNASTLHLRYLATQRPTSPQIASWPRPQQLRTVQLITQPRDERKTHSARRVLSARQRANNPDP